MATSGSDDFATTRDEIIKDSLAALGAIGPNETPDDDMQAHASRVLNDLVKDIDSEGSFLWRVVRDTVTTVASQANYTLTATYLTVDNTMRFTESGATSATILSRISRKEYLELTDRTEESRAPVNFYVEKDLLSDGRVQSTVYFWPTPSTSGDSIEFAGFTRGEDFDTGANNADVPQSWVSCLKDGLTWKLARTYHQAATGAAAKRDHKESLQRLVNDDNERGDMWIIPYGSTGVGGGYS